ncbi:Uncharacterized protein dnm_078250 [Desulfonema magnum]|uniref:Uncharacterized protein n=1 Tax=Desulfonema magnum TaxID=45655 RepID=A0A975GS68_9BACT|nr:Uncharacterized protein dnm_078250 [Desulfonema magnum]
MKFTNIFAFIFVSFFGLSSFLLLISSFLISSFLIYMD